MHFQPPFLPTPLQRKIESYEENTKGAMSGIRASIKPAFLRQYDTTACHREAGSYQMTMSRIITF